MKPQAASLKISRALVLALALSSCGRDDLASSSHLRSDAPNGAIALSDDSPAATVFVRIPSNGGNLGVCLLEVTDCTKSETKLIALNNIKGPYWKSSSPIIIRTNMVISVVEESATERKILLRGKVSRKDNSGANEDIPAPADLTLPKPVNSAAIAYDFMGTLSRDSISSAVMRMIIQEGNLPNAVKVRVKGTIINLRNSSIKLSLDREVDVLDKGVIDFTIKGLDPDTIYRVDGITVQDAAQGTPLKVKDSYFIATTADSKVSKSRRKLVLRALKEAYDWDHGMYDSSLGYAAYGGWCDRFYTWAAALEFKVRNQYSAQSFFRQYNALGDANRIPELGVSANLAGDFIRYEGTSQGTHTFMVVAYDVATKQIWSVEGNFNNRVMRNQRKIYSPWMHGHLVDDQTK